MRDPWSCNQPQSALLLRSFDAIEALLPVRSVRGSIPFLIVGIGDMIVTSNSWLLSLSIHQVSHACWQCWTFGPETCAPSMDRI